MKKGRRRITDKERLDFLQKTMSEPTPSGTFYYFHDGQYKGFGLADQSKGFPTVRQAIDAAIRASREGK